MVGQAEGGIERDHALAAEQRQHADGRDCRNDDGQGQIDFQSKAQCHAEKTGLRQRFADVGHSSPHDDAAERRRDQRETDCRE